MSGKVFNHPNTLLNERVKKLEGQLKEKQVDVEILRDFCCRLLNIVSKADPTFDINQYPNVAEFLRGDNKYRR